MQALIKPINTLSQGWLWLAVLLMPVIALAGGLGFQATGCALGISAFIGWVLDRKSGSYLRAAWPLWLIAFLLWAWVSTLWSSHDKALLWGGNASVLTALVLFMLFIPLIVLNTPERLKSALIWTVIVAGLVGVALLLIDAATGHSVTFLGDPIKEGEDPVYRAGRAEMNLGRGQVSYALLLWPVAGLLMAKMKRGALIALAAFIGLMISAQLNNLSIIIPTLLLAGSFAVLAWFKPKLGLRLGFLIAIASLVFAPVLGLMSSLFDAEMMAKFPLSWEHRLRMWSYSWELIQQAPLFGHGFDASRAYDALTFRAPDGRDIVVLSLHPHNIGLHIWLEIGLIGVLLAAGFLLSLMKLVIRICSEPSRAFVVTGLIVSIAASGAVTVGVWQHWWWALIVMAVSLTCFLPSKLQPTQE